MWAVKAKKKWRRHVTDVVMRLGTAAGMGKWAATRTERPAPKMPGR